MIAPDPVGTLRQVPIAAAENYAVGGNVLGNYLERNEGRRLRLRHDVLQHRGLDLSQVLTDCGG